MTPPTKAITSKIEARKNVLKRGFSLLLIPLVVRAARLAIFEYIEYWYNKKRIHGSIRYITPQECEDLGKKTE